MSIFFFLFFWLFHFKSVCMSLCVFSSFKYLHKCTIIYYRFYRQNIHLKQMKYERNAFMLHFFCLLLLVKMQHVLRYVAKCAYFIFKSMVSMGYYLFNSFVKQKAILNFFVFASIQNTHTHTHYNLQISIHMWLYNGIVKI